MFKSTTEAPAGLSLKDLTEKERDGLARGEDFFTKGFGYNLEQSTRPGTLGLVLSSSPIALLSWSVTPSCPSPVTVT